VLLPWAQFYEPGQTQPFTRLTSFPYLQVGVIRNIQICTCALWFPFNLTILEFSVLHNFVQFLLFSHKICMGKRNYYFPLSIPCVYITATALRVNEKGNENDQRKFSLFSFFGIVPWCSLLTLHNKRHAIFHTLGYHAQTKNNIQAAWGNVGLLDIYQNIQKKNKIKKCHVKSLFVKNHITKYNVVLNLPHFVYSFTHRSSFMRINSIATKIWPN
jgi:hypothetical protein